MPPKGKAGGGKKPKEEEREDTLQAVILADSYERRFAPFTDTKPRCLLPLANIPLIEYTLEFLAHVGVEEAFVLCGADSEQLEEYIKNSTWKQSTSPLSLEFIRSPATSIGDAMRDLDNRDLITGDFLLVSGDVVSNLAIAPALAEHRARRAKNKSAIMTMVLREMGHVHRTKPKSARPIFFIDPRNDQCVHYEEITRKRNGKHKMFLDAQISKEHPEIDIRGDLLDPYIDICTPDVLSLWSDNFDYQSMRTSFLFGVLKDFELNGKTIHTHIVDHGYAARVRSLRAYDAITRDIIGRFAYPFAPDCNILQGHTYNISKNKVYMEKGVVLARGSQITRRSIVGSRTSIGDGSTVTDSVLGRRCQIGKNVTIKDSYIWDDVVIDDNTIIDKGVIASESVISKNCTIKPGTLVSFGVQISAGTVTEERSVHAQQVKKQESDGFDSDSDESIGSGHLLSLSPTPSFVSVDSISTVHSEGDLEDDYDLSDDSADILDPDPAPTFLQRDFVKEASASIYDGILTKEPADKIRLELVAQRLASDAADTAVRDALVEGFMRRIWALVEGIDSEKFSPGTAVKEVLDGYGSLLKQMGIFDGSSEKKPDQVAVLEKIEESCQGKAKGAEVLLFASKEAYDGGLLEDEGILEWWDKPVEGSEKVRKLTEQFVEFLRDDGSEEEDSEEEESD